MRHELNAREEATMRVINSNPHGDMDHLGMNAVPAQEPAVSLVNDLIEKSKLDNAIIVGSEIRAALAEPVGPDRKIDLNGNIYTIAEALAMWQKDLNESEARAKRIEALERELEQAHKDYVRESDLTTATEREEYWKTESQKRQMAEVALRELLTRATARLAAHQKYIEDRNLGQNAEDMYAATVPVLMAIRAAGIEVSG